MPATRGGMTAERVISSRKPSASGLRALMRPERGKASVAPAHTCSELFRGEGFSPLREDTREVLVAVDRGICRTQSAQAFSDRKSTRLNSSHSQISYAVFCLKKKTLEISHTADRRQRRL